MDPRTGGWLAGLKLVHLARDNGCGVGVAFPACAYIAYIEERGESRASGSHVSSQNGLPPPLGRAGAWGRFYQGTHRSNSCS